MNEVTYKPTFQSNATIEAEKIERRPISIRDIFKRDESDTFQKELLPSDIYLLAQQIKEQKRWVIAAQKYTELLEKVKINE